MGVQLLAQGGTSDGTEDWLYCWVGGVDDEVGLVSLECANKLRIGVEMTVLERCVGEANGHY